MPARPSDGSSPRRLARRVASVLPPVRHVLEERDALRSETQRLRTQVRKLRSTQRRYDDYEYLFVMAYGRSGSTLLQAILNSTPGVLIRGENRALPYYLHQFHKTALTEANRVGDSARRKVNPFFGMRDYPTDVAVERMRELLLDTVLRPEPSTKLLGFKEIRWYQDDLPDYLAFMQQVFPGARFILNTRNLDDTAQSSWWADNPDAMPRLQEIEDRMLSAADALGGSVFHLRYDDYVSDPSRLRELFDWLGLDFDDARVRKVMERKYAQIPGAKDSTQAEGPRPS